MTFKAEKGPPATGPRMRAVRTGRRRGAVGLRPMSGRARRGVGRVLGPALLLFGVVALDWAAFGPFALFGVRPQLLLVLACAAALHSGPAAGAWFGGALGLLADVGGGHLLGLSVFSYGAAAYTAGMLSARLFSDRTVLVLAAVALGTGVEQVVYVAGAYAFGHPLDGLALLPRLLPPLIVYHWALTPPLYPVGRWLVRLATEESTVAP